MTPLVTSHQVFGVVPRCVGTCVESKILHAYVACHSSAYLRRLQWKPQRCLFGASSQNHGHVRTVFFTLFLSLADNDGSSLGFSVYGVFEKKHYITNLYWNYACLDSYYWTRINMVCCMFKHIACSYDICHFFKLTTAFITMPATLDNTISINTHITMIYDGIPQLSIDKTFWIKLQQLW